MFIMNVIACDSSLVLMISFCTGVDIMARYQLRNNNNNNNNNNMFAMILLN